MSALDLETKIIVRDGTMTIGRSQDCTPIAEFAKAAHNEGRHGSSEMRHAAKLPYVIVEKYCNDNNVEFADFMADPAHIKRMLNDPSLSHFRIWKGRVG